MLLNINQLLEQRYTADGPCARAVLLNYLSTEFTVWVVEIQKHKETVRVNTHKRWPIFLYCLKIQFQITYKNTALRSKNYPELF